MKSTIIVVLLSLYSISCIAQDTIYYNKDKHKIDSKENAHSYKVRIIDLQDPTHLCIKTYSLSNQLRKENNYYIFKKDNKKKKYKNGSKRLWYKNGQLKHEENYKLNKLNGETHSYFKNGTLKRKAIYKNDSLLSGKCYTKEGQDTLFYPHMLMPNFYGGTKELYKFLSKNIIYPKKEKKKKNQGRVITQFVVDKDGSIKDIQIVKSSGNYLFDNEAIRVVSKMPKWTAGKKEGKTVRVKYTLPITFKIK